MKESLEIIHSEKNNFSFKPETYILLFGLLICLVAWLTIEKLNLFGHKSNSIFDIWTIVHISTGAALGFVMIGLQKFKIHHPIILLLLISSTWEIVEHYLEIKGPPTIANWFAGEESLLNRLFADQLSLVVGFALVKYKPMIFPFALAISLTILIAHIILGDSMYFFK